MKIFVVFCLSAFLLSCATTKSNEQIYFQTVKANHKMIAILPAVVNIKPGKTQKLQFKEGELDKAALKLGFIIQNELYEQIKNIQ